MILCIHFYYLGGIMEKNKSLMVCNKLSKTEYYILYVFIYSFIGWLLETGYAIYELGGFTKRGFLYGPICPIYGFGAIILLICLNNCKQNSFKTYILSAILFSLFEYIVGFALDALFAAKWWDYSNEFFNLNGRISILFSFVWGIFGLIFINNIHPYISKKLDKILINIPYLFQRYVVTLLCIILLIDTVLSSIKYINLM